MSATNNDRQRAVGEYRGDHRRQLLLVSLKVRGGLHIPQVECVGQESSPGWERACVRSHTVELGANRVGPLRGAGAPVIPFDSFVRREIQQ